MSRRLTPHPDRCLSTTGLVGTAEAPSLGGDHYDLDGAHGAAMSFRPDRFTPDELNIHHAAGQYVDDDGKLRDCSILNISSGGAAFALPQGELLRNGQVIDSFAMSLDGVTLYSGRVHVVNQRDVEGETVVGVAFAEEYLSPGRLDSASRQAAAVRELGQRFAELEAVIDAPIDDWVKVLAADLRLFLGELRESLDALVPLGASHEVERSAVRFIEKRTAGRFQAYVRRLNEIPARVPAAHADAVRSYMKRQLQELLLPAPIYRQSFFKPLGYAGDFVTMNIAYTNHYQGDSAYAKLLNRFFCDLAVSRAAISRVGYLEGWIRRTVAEGEAPVRILSLASGPARELQDFLAESSHDAPVEFTLFDQDTQALAFAQAQLVPVAKRFGERVTMRYVNGAVKHLVKEPARFAAFGGQTLIYTAGLFDYLRDRPAAALLRNLFELLAPGGRLVVGNLAPSCDSRGFLENLVDWEMIYRDEEALLALAQGLPASAREVQAEATGVNKFLVLQR